MKYKNQFERKFKKQNAVITGFSSGGYCATLTFSNVPMTVLTMIADELTSSGYCQHAEVECDSIELIDPDCMMCEFDGLKTIVKEILKERNYELSECDI